MEKYGNKLRNIFDRYTDQTYKTVDIMNTKKSQIFLDFNE